MHQTVQPAKFVADYGGELVVIYGGRGSQVERRDRRARCAQFFDLIVDAIKLGLVASRQNDTGAGPRTLDRKRTAEAAARARHEDYAPGQQIA